MKDKITTIIMITIFIVLLFAIYNLSKESANVQLSDNVEKVSENIEEEALMEVKSISSENFEEEVLKSDKKVLIDFYADWCGPCKMLSPIVEKVASENDNIKVVKIDIDQNEDLAIKYGVSSIPTLIVVENGETKNISVGLISKSEVEALIK